MAREPNALAVPEGVVATAVGEGGGRVDHLLSPGGPTVAEHVGELHPGAGDELRVLAGLGAGGVQLLKLSRCELLQGLGEHDEAEAGLPGGDHVVGHGALAVGERGVGTDEPLHAHSRLGECDGHAIAILVGLHARRHGGELVAIPVHRGGILHGLGRHVAVGAGALDGQRGLAEPAEGVDHQAVAVAWLAALGVAFGLHRVRPQGVAEVGEHVHVRRCEHAHPPLAEGADGGDGWCGGVCAGLGPVGLVVGRALHVALGGGLAGEDHRPRAGELEGSHAGPSEEVARQIHALDALCEGVLGDVGGAEVLPRRERERLRRLESVGGVESALVKEEAAEAFEQVVEVGLVVAVGVAVGLEEDEETAAFAHVGLQRAACGRAVGLHGGELVDALLGGGDDDRVEGAQACEEGRLVERAVEQGAVLHEGAVHAVLHEFAAVAVVAPLSAVLPGLAVQEAHGHAAPAVGLSREQKHGEHEVESGAWAWHGRSLLRWLSVRRPRRRPTRRRAWRAGRGRT